MRVKKQGNNAVAEWTTKNPKAAERFSKDPRYKVVKPKGVSSVFKIQMIVPADEIRIRISEENSKLGKIASFSLSSIDSCGRDSVHCRKTCYAYRNELQYPNVAIARQLNTYLARYELERLEAQLHAHFKGCGWNLPPYFRWGVHGDNLPVKDDPKYFEMCLRIMRAYPSVRFLMYTKVRPGEIPLQSYDLPENLSLFQSMFPDMKRNAHHDVFPVAWHYDPKKPDPRIPADAPKCPGSCSECNLFDKGPYCWHPEATAKGVVFDKH
jgi:hypothetical protein